MMNCPSCGSKTVADQQFCRMCGAGLAADGPRRIPRTFWGLMMAFAGILIAMAGNMVDVRAVVFIGAFTSIVGMFAMVAIPMLLQARRRRKPRISLQPESLASAEPTNKLPPMTAADHFPSVTENTTNLLIVTEPKTPRSLSL